MDSEQKAPSELKNTTYELFIAALSVLSIVNLVIYYLADDPQVEDVVFLIDGVLSLIFLSDFTYRLFTTDSNHEARPEVSTPCDLPNRLYDL